MESGHLNILKESHEMPTLKIVSGIRAVCSLSQMHHRDCETGSRNN